MDSGTIIYLILGAALLLFNLFNSSNKRKKQKEEQEKARQQTTNQHTNNKVDEDWWLKPSPSTIPKVPSAYVRKEFQSSLGSGYGEESPAFESSSRGNYETRGGRKITRASSVHPLLNALANDSGTDELRRAVIYSEILQRKY